MEASKFDELTKALATATSRRQALRRIGGILGGTALAGLFPGLALAGGGNSACAKFCDAVFGADTPAAGKCISDAAHGRGMCYTCGPAAPAGHPPLCGQVCCTSGQTCSNGTCVTPCNPPCPSGQVCLSNGTCVTPCGANCSFAPCPCAACACERNLCGHNALTMTCSSDHDCPQGQFCDSGFCFAAC